MLSSLVVLQCLRAVVQWTSQHDEPAWISTGTVHPEMDAITFRGWRTSPCLLCCSDQQVSMHLNDLSVWPFYFLFCLRLLYYCVIRSVTTYCFSYFSYPVRKLLSLFLIAFGIYKICTTEILSD